MTAPAAAVRFWCGRCEQPLTLSDSLWKSPNGDYRCDVGGYPTSSGGEVIYVERVMHDLSSSWVHPALRTETKEDAA